VKRDKAVAQYVAQVKRIEGRPVDAEAIRRDLDGEESLVGLYPRKRSTTWIREQVSNMKQRAGATSAPKASAPTVTVEISRNHVVQAVVCQEPTCRKRDGWIDPATMRSNGHVDPDTGRNLITWDGTGRVPMYCSDACKMANYRRRRDDKAGRAAIQAEQQRQDGVMRRLAASFAVELESLSRTSTTQREEMAVRLAGIAIGQLGQGRLC
jgi:hypothetical protein